MATGTVKWFHETRGYGFITPDWNDKDIYLHISELHKANMHILIEGEKVAFDIGEHNGRRAAINLRRPNTP